jgi:hypothetical protein
MVTAQGPATLWTASTFSVSLGVLCLHITMRCAVLFVFFTRFDRIHVLNNESLINILYVTHVRHKQKQKPTPHNHNTQS